MLRRFFTGVLMLDMVMSAMANPHGMTVQDGSATATVSGSQLTIIASQNALLNWQSFNIAAGETTVFQQPSFTSIVWNRINDQNPSQIYGSLQANGIVVLLNSSGFYFGPNSFVSAAGLVVSTANCLPPQNSAGSWEFNGPPPLASIVNYGQIKIGSGGSAFLIADNVENHGTISAPRGTIGLAAGQTVLLSERPDGRGMSMAVTLPSGSVDNEGRLIADGGTIAMNARVVNQDGFIQANSVRKHDGIIELVASDQLSLGADSQILARGDDTSHGSSGGDVSLKSGNTFNDDMGSLIDVSGGSRGGNGGNVEISAPNILSLNSSVNAGAQAGWSGGVFALDPVDIVLGTVSSAPLDNNGTIDGTSGSGVFYVDVNNEFKSITAGQIVLKASGDIYVGNGTVNSGGTFTPSSGVTWDLTSSAGNQTSGKLTLEATGNITLDGGSKIVDANSWSVALYAGYNFANNSVSFGKGSILLQGGSGFSAGGSIQTAKGDIDLNAGQDILLDNCFVRTTAGGNVSASALAGDVNTGTYAFGYKFYPASSLNSAYYKVDPANGVGGISTEAGGNVTITAGKDVTSYLPQGNSAAALGDAGSGAFGPQVGNVTIVAGGNVIGHYVEANGTGAIYAGVKMVNGIPVDADGNPVTDGKSYVLDSTTGSAGTANNLLALSLIAGGWTVDAAQDIYLQEVRNPNGVFNSYTSGGTIKPTYHYFNYAKDAYVNLSAGNSVHLGDDSSNLPRDNSDSIDIPFIYAPILNIVAGAGGVTLNEDSDPYNKLILFPSPQGSLTITTTGGGSLTVKSVANGDGPLSIFDLIVSDSGQSQYYDNNLDIFGLSDHATTPVHYDSSTPNHYDYSTPIVLNISGNMNNVLLGAPEAAQITVIGDMVNSRFQGMNLSSDPNQSVQVPVREIDGSLGTATVHPGLTSINVAGDIKNRSEFTTATLPPPPDLSLLKLIPLPNPILVGLLTYDAKTGLYTFNGPVTEQALKELSNVTIQGNVQVNVLDPGVAPGTLGPNAQILLAAYVSGATTTTVMFTPNLSFLSEAYLGSTLAGHLVYNSLMGQLTFQGAVTEQALKALADLTIQEVDSQGNPILQQVNVLDPSVALGKLGPNALALQAEYALVGSVPTSLDSGYLLGGGGQFNITAHNMDLGSTLGIQSQGVSFDTYTVDNNGNSTTHYPLAQYFTQGADINVNLTGNLDMFSTTIATLNGGNIYINADGYINVGSPVFSQITSTPRGIFSTGQGNVDVYANGTIDVNGSRIAAYDTRQDNSSGTPGGSVTVVSRNGDIDAGNGSSGFVMVNSFQVGPGPDYSVAAISSTIPGSGIMEVSYTQPGNILVETPNGTVNAGAGGILQLLLNGPPFPESTTLFDLPLDHAGLAKMFDLALGGKMKAALDLEHILNGNPGDSQVDVFAGYELQKLDGSGNPIVDAFGNPMITALNLSEGALVKISDDRDIDATGSGVIGAGSVTLKASGNITGNIFALGNVNATAVNNINVSVLGLGDVNVNSTGGGTISGNIIGINGVSASGGSIDANLESNGSVTGDTSGEKGLAPGTAADVASQSVASEDAAKTAAAASSDDQDDEKKKKGRPVALAQKTGRVTVVLPQKNSPGSKNSNPGSQTPEPRT
jgi:filamentous hemagglutinin family protein